MKEDFPIFSDNKELVYLDSTATSQKPKHVIEAIENFYTKSNANIHRGIYDLSERATEMYEGARREVAEFVNAHPGGIVFVRNATEGINLVANSLDFKKGDEIVTTIMEHHSNIVPWQMLKEKGVVVKFMDINEKGALKISKFTNRTKLVAVCHVSNVLGTINPVEAIGKLAHKAGALFLVDAAQSVPHMPVDFRKIDADFMVFSGHKMLGPSGIGVLCAKPELLKAMKPFLGGGDMIKEVHLDETKWNDIPWKFEAGTPNIEGAIGLGAAVKYLKKVGMMKIRAHEIELTKYALNKLSKIKDIAIYGPKDANDRGGVVAFNLKDIHAHDIAAILNEYKVAIRSGYHCAQPLAERLGVNSTARASFYLYNNKKDVDKLVDALKKVLVVFNE